MKKASINLNSLESMSWSVSNHILFASKCRWKVFFIQKRLELGEIRRKVDQRRGIETIDKEIIYQKTGENGKAENGLFYTL